MVRRKFLDYDTRHTPKTDRYCVCCQRDLVHGGKVRMVYLHTTDMMITHPEDVSRDKMNTLTKCLIGVSCAKLIGEEWTVPEQ